MSAAPVVAEEGRWTRAGRPGRAAGPELCRSDADQRDGLVCNKSWQRGTSGKNPADDKVLPATLYVGEKGDIQF